MVNLINPFYIIIDYKADEENNCSVVNRENEYFSADHPELGESVSRITEITSLR